LFLLFNHQHPRQQHILTSLQTHGIRRGAVLVLGDDPEPFALQLDKRGFDVQSITLDHLKDMAQRSGKQVNSFKKPFDIIIVDNLLQFLPSPYTTIRLLKKQLVKGGILIVTSPNAARGKARLKILMGKNVYPLTDDEGLGGNMCLDYIKAFYREYTLGEIKTLLSQESFYVLKMDFMNGHKDTSQNHSFLRGAYRWVQNMAPSLRNDMFLMARGNFTNGLPEIRKKDPFKLTSMHRFNTKWLRNYDSPSRFKQFFMNRWDKDVVDSLPGDFTFMRILDVGCGWGRLLTGFADAGAQQLAGIDLAPRMVDLVRQRLAERGVQADMKVADAEDTIPWENEYFDVITLTGGFHHFYRPLDALQEMRRVLKKKGLLIIADPYFFPPVRQILNYLCSFKAADGDYRFYTHQEVSEMVKSVGFTSSQQRLSLNTFVVIALK
jgi:ubiquinone/menaquinone biosynthesis C-methylase UbiE